MSVLVMRFNAFGNLLNTSTMSSFSGRVSTSGASGVSGSSTGVFTVNTFGLFAMSSDLSNGVMSSSAPSAASKPLVIACSSENSPIEPDSPRDRRFTKRLNNVTVSSFASSGSASSNTPGLPPKFKLVRDFRASAVSRPSAIRSSVASVTCVRCKSSDASTARRVGFVGSARPNLLSNAKTGVKSLSLRLNVVRRSQAESIPAPTDGIDVSKLNTTSVNA